MKEETDLQPGEKEIVIERRYAILQVTPELLVEICKGQLIKRFFIEKHALPEDARIVGVGAMNSMRQVSVFDTSHQIIGIVVESASYEPVLPGMPLPILDPPSFRLIQEGPHISEVDSKCPACGAIGPVGLRPINTLQLKCETCFHIVTIGEN